MMAGAASQSGSWLSPLISVRLLLDVQYVKQESGLAHHRTVKVFGSTLGQVQGTSVIWMLWVYESQRPSGFAQGNSRELVQTNSSIHSPPTLSHFSPTQHGTESNSLKCQGRCESVPSGRSNRVPPELIFSY